MSLLFWLLKYAPSRPSLPLLLSLLLHQALDTRLMVGWVLDVATSHGLWREIFSRPALICSRYQSPWAHLVFDAAFQIKMSVNIQPKIRIYADPNGAKFGYRNSAYWYQREFK